MTILDEIAQYNIQIEGCWRKINSLIAAEKAKRENEAYLIECDDVRQKSIELHKLANDNGLISGVWILSSAFPNTKLRIGFGMVWSSYQKALVVGCTDINNSYYTAVPIYHEDTNAWAEIVSPPTK